MSSVRVFNPKDAPRGVLILDFDGVQHAEDQVEEIKVQKASKNGREKKYPKKTQSSGVCQGHLIDSEAHNRMIALAHKFRIAIFTLTSREDIQEEHDYIFKAVNGDKDEARIKKEGGIPAENIICLGKGMKDKKGNRVLLSMNQSKYSEVRNIHEKHFPTLPRKNFLFIDDNAENIKPFIEEKEADKKYPFLLVKTDSNEHYEKIFEFISRVAQVNYSKEHTVFEPVETAQTSTSAVLVSENTSAPTSKKEKTAII